ncbi:M16 family metallopeptidase [Dysgonomonas macrotermitis]|uniref:Predicted Zn-dependent peptidase n=1 Tax=Dysgonomonas macrotermitis TaxID=1346286 RepID=A0A1M5H442_9BACT|nr:pitrilysin family protein [Dysgonomonas macrotermitis]SHG10750.1 Predicted Zn-dependent peptidase [Dysgonomonas macrotermitis]
MKKIFSVLGLLFISGAVAVAQHIDYDEYTLDNGLHVILQQDNSAPVVTTAVMYHVGAKDENPERTGFAHFFEHLLFEGTENIARGQWDKIMAANGGTGNANTTDDRTYYYETFPSNNLELALWMESERMFHPVINQIGVDTQREVVKEEKRARMDNAPYGRLWEVIKSNLFTKHPYRWAPIGSMEHLNAATLDEFKEFFKNFYMPSNAVLVIAGDFDKEQTKKWVNEYFGSIPSISRPEKTKYVEDPITTQINATAEDPNIQLPMLLNAYRTPSMKERDARVLDMISSILSDGKSSRLYKRLVDKDKLALEAASFNLSEEDYSAYIIYAIPMTGKTLAEVQTVIDEEIAKVCTELISEREFQKIQNQYENSAVSQNATSEGIAHNLASYYLLYGDTKLINTEIDIYRSITREEIRSVAQKYLQPNQRVVIDYVPQK